MNAFPLDLEHDDEDLVVEIPRRLRYTKLTCCICKAKKVDLIAHVRDRHPGTLIATIQGRVFMPLDLDCPECGSGMGLQPSKYGRGQVYYACTSAPFCCGAHAADRFGRPVGEPVDRDTKDLRSAAESVFTATWRGPDTRFGSRKLAFRWLRGALDIPLSHIHIDRLDGETCKRLIAAVWEFRQAI